MGLFTGNWAVTPAPEERKVLASSTRPALMKEPDDVGTSRRCLDLNCLIRSVRAWDCFGNASQAEHCRLHTNSCEENVLRDFTRRDSGPASAKSPGPPFAQ